jgi:hypothetical protein
MITPQGGISNSTVGIVRTKPLTIAALNAIRANAHPQDFGEDQRKWLPDYVLPANRLTHPNLAGGQ